MAVRMKRTYHPNKREASQRIKELKKNGFRVRDDPIFNKRMGSWLVYYTHEDPERVE